MSLHSEQMVGVRPSGARTGWEPVSAVKNRGKYVGRNWLGGSTERKVKGEDCRGGGRGQYRRGQGRGVGVSRTSVVRQW